MLRKYYSRPIMVLYSYTFCATENVRPPANVVRICLQLRSEKKKLGTAVAYV